MGRRPDGTIHPTAEMCAAAGVPQLLHILNAARPHVPWTHGPMPDGFVVRHLMFAEGLVGLGGVIDRPRATCRHRVVAALSRVLTSPPPCLRPAHRVIATASILCGKECACGESAHG
eukprot:366571-Chlamydomonas_euryale.AAC.27